jgi:hypothetical protein
MAVLGKNLSGANVRKFRDQLGLSQEEFAAKCQLAGWDIARGVIAKIETGTRCVDDIELVRLARILGVKVQDLLPESLGAGE